MATKKENLDYVAQTGYNVNMSTKAATIRARVTPELKTSAEGIFKELGLSTTEAITLFYRQVTLRKGLPFEVRIPNEETVETMRKTDAGEDLHYAESAEDLFEQLGI